MLCTQSELLSGQLDTAASASRTASACSHLKEIWLISLAVLKRYKHEE
jgi:hypothetical protein